MNFNLTGSYTIQIPVQNMFLNTSIKVKSHNIITVFGESFFLNRAINDNFDPIQYICLGNGKNKANKNDIQLGNETIRKKCVKNVNLDKKQIILNANFPVKDIYGTSEIGVHNGKVLISHDLYEKLDENFLTPTIGDVTVTYVFQFSTGTYKTGWKTATSTTNTYYVAEPNTVIGVSENEGNAYRRVNSKTLVDSTNGSFWYDSDTSNLYIHTVDGTDPNNKEIIVQHR